MSDLDRYLTEHDRRIHDELFDLLRIPSVSARSEHAGDVRRAAEWVRDSLGRIGFEASINDTPGHPIVLGEWRKAPGAPTILVYGHYDVQPAEPLDLWESPPFEPTLRDGRIYARGSVDDKGQLFLHIKAVEAILSPRVSSEIKLRAPRGQKIVSIVSNKRREKFAPGDQGTVRVKMLSGQRYRVSFA